jgi:tripartite-type tricarboxylate transporter receptor subunit TctC
MKRNVLRSVLIAVAIMAWASVPFGCAVAQQYPIGPIRILVGFGPGSVLDILARVIGKQMERDLGQPVVIENRLGNGSMIAAEAAARAPKDGYTLFVGGVANTINPSRTNSKFNLATDMQSVALLAVVPNLLVGHPSVPAKDIKELIALAKAKPDSLTFGTSGAGTASHLAAELFNVSIGRKIVAVHYAGGSNQMLTDLLAARITLSFSVANNLMPHVRSGALRAYAVAQPKRAGIAPDVPTLAEIGLPSVDAGIWAGLYVPRGTPMAIVHKLSVSANSALKTAPVKKVLDTQGIDPLGGNPEELAKFTAADIEKWVGVLKAAGLRK